MVLEIAAAFLTYKWLTAKRAAGEGPTGPTPKSIVDDVIDNAPAVDTAHWSMDDAQANLDAARYTADQVREVVRDMTPYGNGEAVRYIDGLVEQLNGSGQVNLIRDLRGVQNEVRLWAQQQFAADQAAANVARLAELAAHARTITIPAFDRETPWSDQPYWRNGPTRPTLMWNEFPVPAGSPMPGVGGGTLLVVASQAAADEYNAAQNAARVPPQSMPPEGSTSGGLISPEMQAQITGQSLGVSGGAAILGSRPDNLYFLL